MHNAAKFNWLIEKTRILYVYSVVDSFFTTPELFQGIPEFLHLFEMCYCSTAVEASCESVG